MGRLLDRFGARRMTAVVVLLFGAACLALGAAANLVWLAAGFAALRCLGMGALMLGCTNLVSQWFSRRRGFALSLMALGFAASMAIHPPLGQYLVETLGWRRAWVLGPSPGRCCCRSSCSSTTGRRTRLTGRRPARDSGSRCRQRRHDRAERAHAE